VVFSCRIALGLAPLVLAACTVEVADVVVDGTNSNEPVLVAYLAELRHAAQLAPRSAQLRGRLGMAYDANDFFDAAGATYEQAATLDPTEFAWPYLQAAALANRGDYAGALNAMDRALALDTGYPGAWLLRGGWLLDTDEHADARAAYEQAVALAQEPATRAAARVGVARAMLRQEQPQAAAALLQEEQFSHPYVHQVLATAYLRIGRSVEARALQATLGEAPQAKLEWPDAIRARTSTYVRGFGGQLKIAERMLKNGQGQAALAILQDLRAQESDIHRLPDGRRLLNTLCFAYRLLDRIDQAESVLAEALETYPDFPLFHFTSAVLLEGRGDRAGALEQLDQAIALDPALLAAYERKFDLLRKEQRFGEALAVIEERLTYGNVQPQKYFDAGLVAGSLTRWPQAIAYFEQALALDPGFARAELFLGRSLAEAGQFKAAEAALAAAARQGSDPNDIAAATKRLQELRTGEAN
jgi:tetratricopeptide (TPR) repeat protein